MLHLSVWPKLLGVASGQEFGKPFGARQKRRITYDFRLVLNVEIWSLENDEIGLLDALQAFDVLEAFIRFRIAAFRFSS